MGCRSFLTPYVDPETGKPKYYGRFNQGVVTINLVDVALSSGGNFEKFWKIFDERLNLCHRALQARHKRLLGTPSDAAPILWQYGALARLKKGEKIDKLLFGGYSTISLGYAGLYECVKYMTGKSHTDAGAKPFALSVMQHMNDKCNAWKMCIRDSSGAPLLPKLRGNFADLPRPLPLGAVAPQVDVYKRQLPTCVGLLYGHRRNTHSFSRHLPSRTSVLTSLDRYRNQHPAPRLHMCPCV